MRHLVPAVAAILISVSAYSQEYFQQQTDYEINVILDGFLKGNEKIVYTNNSPDTLGYIYFHLWPNAYSSNSTALAAQIFRNEGKQKLFMDPDLKGFIDSLDFSVDGTAVEHQLLQDKPDICIVYLPEPLIPGGSAVIETPFRVKIPSGNISRMGYNGGVYQITQWYPKPAVYDVNGWHPMVYLDQGEYYSEFGTYDVTITLPENYVVAASGELQTEDEIKWLAETASSWQVYDSRHEEQLKTIRYRGEGIHDFAWVASKRFRVVQDTIVLPNSGRKVKTMVFFTGSQGWLWEKAIGHVSKAILNFSEWIGDYPYSTFSAVQAPLAAGSGMEYPGLAIIGNAGDDVSLNEVITHEIAHNWFYSALGSDERRFPYIDEGLSTAYEERQMELIGEKKLWEYIFRKEGVARFMGIAEMPAGRISEINWLESARNNLEQPLNLPADMYSSENYGELVYYKAGQAFNYLRSYLGNDIFDSIMQGFYSDWNGKHFSPGDLAASFREGTGRDLSWFFDDYLGTTKRYNYAVSGLKEDKLKIRNKGELNSPVQVAYYIGDSVVCRQWLEGFSGTMTFSVPGISFTSLRLNADHIVPELYLTDNNIRREGLFRRSDRMVPRLLMPVEDPDRRTLMMVPLVNWNRADGFMAGLSVNNGTMLPKRIEYYALPFYTFSEQGFAGKGKLAFNIIPYNLFVRKASLFVEGSHFGAVENRDYTLLRAGVETHLRKTDFINGPDHSLVLSFTTASDLQLLLADQGTVMVNFWQAGYRVERMSTVNPFRINLLGETNGNYAKVSAEFNYKLSYTGRGAGLETRFFAGTMFGNAGREMYSFAVSGRSGSELYLFGGDFPDRFSVFPQNFWSRQMAPSEGGIVTPVNDTLGYTRRILSASVATTLPGLAGKLPLKPFVNMAYSGTTAEKFFWEAGIKAGIWNFFEVHVPFLVSENISFRSNLNERIRFILNLESLYRIRLP